MKKGIRSGKSQAAVVTVRYILSFILALILTCIVLLGMLELSFANHTVILDIFAEDEYAQAVQDFVLTTSGNVTYTVGISDEELYGDALSPERLQREILAYVQAALEGGTYITDMEEFQQELYENILIYMDHKGFERNTENLKAARSLAWTVAGYYKKGIEFPYLSNIAALLRKIERYAKYALIGGGAASLLIIALLLMSCRRKYHAAKFIVYAILSAMINILVPTLLLYFNRIHERLTINTAFIQFFISHYINSGLHQLLRLCLYFIPVVAALLIWEAISYKIAWNKDTKHYHHRRHSEEGTPASESGH